MYNLIGLRSDNKKGEITMKIKTTKMQSPLACTLLKAERAQGRIYCLVELRVFENTVYCISITEGEDFCAELAGEDRAAVHRTFELLCDEGVPPYQLFDIISDAKRESVERNLR